MVLDIGTMLVTKVKFNIHFFCEKQSSAVSPDTFCNKTIANYKRIKVLKAQQNSKNHGQLCMQACPGGHVGISQSTGLS